MNFLKKALGTIVEFEDEPKTKPYVPEQAKFPQKPSHPIDINSIPTVNSKYTVSFSKEDLDKFEKHFNELISQANLPGPDYYEFSKIMDSLETAIPDERTRIIAAFKSLEVQGLTKDNLFSSAQTYIQTLEADRDKFQQASTAKYTNEVSGRKQEISDLDAKIAKNKEDIAKLTQDIANIEAQKLTLSNEISEVESKINKKQGAFMTACEAVISAIKSDIEKAKINL
jgi:chromosome segregation ATPase